MDRYEETFRTWNKVAQLYQDKFMDMTIYNHSYAVFCEALTLEKSSILELGCGPGNITRYLSQQRPDFQIQAIDIAPEMILLAQKNVPTADFKVMDVRKIGNLQQCYDGLVCGFVIPYLSQEEVTRLVRDCQKLLRANGLLYLSFVAGDSTKSGYQIGSSGDRMFFYFHDLEKLTQIIESHEFKILNLLEVPYAKNDTTSEQHTIIIARKI